MIYWDQGDYTLFLEYAKLGQEYKSEPNCGIFGIARRAPR
jgi:hypothetical protein